MAKPKLDINLASKMLRRRGGKYRAYTLAELHVLSGGKQEFKVSAQKRGKTPWHGRFVAVGQEYTVRVQHGHYYTAFRVHVDGLWMDVWGREDTRMWCLVA